MTPYALINEGYMKISGQSAPVEQNGFFGQINKQIDLYSKEPANETSVDISLSFVNASSKRAIIEFLNQLEKLNKQGFKVSVNWRYERDDEDVKELGEIYQNMFDIKINLISL